MKKSLQKTQKFTIFAISDKKIKLFSIWIFQVEHFSKYALDESDESDDSDLADLMVSRREKLKPSKKKPMPSEITTVAKEGM